MGKFSNYPPGVSGMEREIAGDDELELQIDCVDGQQFKILLDNKHINRIMDANVVEDAKSVIQDCLFDSYPEPCQSSGIWATAMISNTSVKIICPECEEEYVYTNEDFFKQYSEGEVFECRLQ